MSFPRYPKYKPSGVEWLGDVPAHWEVKPIKRLSPVLRGASPRPIDDPKYFDDAGEYSWVRIADVSASDGELKETPQRLSELGSSLSVRLEPGQLFVSIAGTVGKPCITRIRACIHDGFVYFPQLALEPQWLFRIFATGQCYGGLGKLGTQLNLNTDTIGSIHVPLPPESERCAIATFLDRETAKIDGLVAEQQRLIELLKEKRQAVISHAVTKGLDPKAPMKPSGVEWLGDVPAHWEVQRLGNLLREFPCYGVLVPDFEIDGVPMLRIQDMTASSIARHDLTTISRSLSQQYSRTVVEVGDLVLSVVGTIGRSLVIDAELAGVNLSRAVARLQMRDLLLPQVCRWIFCSDYFRQYVDLVCVGTAQRVLNMADLRAFKVAIPPQGEQSAIIAALNAKTCGIDVLLAEAESAITLLQERRSALISAAVTGQLDVRNAVAMEAA